MILGPFEPVGKALSGTIVTENSLQDLVVARVLEGKNTTT